MIVITWSVRDVWMMTRWEMRERSSDRSRGCISSACQCCGNTWLCDSTGGRYVADGRLFAGCRIFCLFEKRSKMMYRKCDVTTKVKKLGTYVAPRLTPCIALARNNNEGSTYYKR